MTNPDFIYTTYIKSTREKVWSAITNPEFTRQYWGGLANVSDWKKGSEWKMANADGKDIKTVGKILESNPPTRLVITWAKPENKANESQVSFDIEMVGDMVRLDVVHSRLSEEMARAISSGWPRVLSSMKSFLETGKPLDVWAGHTGGCGTSTAKDAAA